MNTNILNTLTANGHEAYFVGGCVRDTLMGLRPKDWDIATSATPEQVMALFPINVPVGAAYGVVMVWDSNSGKDSGEWYEVATFRSEGDFNGHKCSVSWTNLHNDASRRDFTINSMYMRSDHSIIDLFGGQKDIETNTLRTVGNASRRFAEDPLRMLRAVRFASKYEMALSDDILKAMDGSLLATISMERIKDELIEILAAGGLRLLSDTGLLAHILPEISRLEQVEQDARHPEGNVFEHTCLVVQAAPKTPIDLMAALLHDVGKFDTQQTHPDGKMSFINHEESTLPREIMTRLKFSNNEIDTVEWLVQNHMRMHKFMEMKKSKRHTLMRHKDFDLLRDLHLADCIGGRKGTRAAEEIDVYCANAVVLEPKCLSDRLITGDDLIRLGYAPGKEMGALLAKLEEAQREGVFDTKEEGLDFLAKM